MLASGRSVLFALLFSAALYLVTLTREFDFPHVPGRLGPDVWPQAILALLMIACVIGIGRDILARRRPEQSPPRLDEPHVLPGDTPAESPSGDLGYWLVCSGLLLILGYPIVLEYLGFPLATFAFMTLFMLVGRWRNPFGVVAVSAIGTIVLFYVFRGVVYVSLPLGRGLFQSATLWIASLLGMR
jgi:putative tricarboxylic transport membrane protein